MRIISIIHDKKIDALNVSFEYLAKSYIETARQIIENNEFQRRRVKNNGSVYALLKKDILSECMIPPIVLALSSGERMRADSINEEFVNKCIKDQFSSLRILDGLQRTYTLIDSFNENQGSDIWNRYKLRLELYLNISEVGILYRMLTLNAGQTPMSLRHQIEILYANYSSNDLSGINIIKHVDDATCESINDFNYSDLIEGYNSFLEKSEFPLDKFSLLETIRSIETVSKIGMDKSGFSNFVNTYYRFSKKVSDLTNDWKFPENEIVEEEYKIEANPFGKNIAKIFNRSQPITGFGAAVGELIDKGAVQDIDEVYTIISSIAIIENKDMMYMIKCLDELRIYAKKIGNAQRIFFKNFFKRYLNKLDDACTLNMKESIDRAYKITMNEI